MFDMTESSSVARQLAACGYGTLAVHPNLAANWNRDVAYQQLGFERFADIDEFEGADVYNNGVADAETYRYVLDQLKEQDKPQFVFDLTMQNHGGYSTAAVPEQDVPGVHPAGLDSGVDDQLNGYLACIEASDRDLRAFVAELEKLDEPTVLLFFGDHHPSFSKQVNDALMPGEDDMTHEQRVHQTVYAMWANYDVAGFEGSLNDDTCSANLGAMLLDAIGAPLTPYQQAQLGARERVKSYDFYGYLCDDGAWRWFDDPGDYATDIHNLATICYQNFTGVSSR